MKLLALIQLAEHHGIDTLQPAMQLAAQVTDQHEMHHLREEIRRNKCYDTQPLAEIKQRLAKRTEKESCSWETW